MGASTYTSQEPLECHHRFPDEQLTLCCQVPCPVHYNLVQVGEEGKEIISSGSPPFDCELKTQKCALFVLASPVSGMGLGVC